MPPVSSCPILILLVFAFDQSDCQTPPSQRNEVIKRNVAESTVTVIILTWQLTHCPTDVAMFSLKTLNIPQHPRDFTLAPPGASLHSLGTMTCQAPPFSKCSPGALYTWFHQMLIITHEVSTIISPFYRCGNWYSKRLKDLPKITRQRWDSHSGSRGARAHAHHLPKPITAHRCGFKSRLCYSLAVWLLANSSVSLVFESTSAVCTSQGAIVQIDSSIDSSNRQS